MDARPPFVLPDPPISPPSIAHLLTSNSAPEGLEEHIVRGHLAELESQAAFLENVITVFALQRPDLLPSIEAHALQHADVLRSIEDHKSILSPMRRLANELLAEIFMVVVQDAFYSESPNSGPTSEYPWVLVRVCRRWNAVASNTQSLWSWVYLNLDSMDDERGAVPVTQLFHKRSGNSPLTVKIQQLYERSKSRVLTVALAHCERWQSLTLFATDSCVIYDMAVVRCRLPALTTLNIDGGALEAATGVAIDYNDTFAVVPNLTAARVAIHQALFELPWRQLTRLSLNVFCREEALPILAQLSSALVELRVEWRDPFPLVPDWRGITITLPRLHTLELVSQCAPAQSAISLLSFFNTPLLEHLETQGDVDEDAVLSFITRSRCKKSLKSLHFLLDSNNSDRALSLVGRMPHLLHLKFGNLSKADIESFTAGCTRIGSNDFRAEDPDISYMQMGGLFIKILSCSRLWPFDSLVDAKFEVY
ncbi:hypothetical protein FB45DRAFT_1051187 [Roridomyces roridus]|uniref:F-box domain-containing protein n=1 Tax=Roridomyces roridus TaxID=1738132 RepID=A0AAD7FVU4_9AGAR|nr:hypothetical protein FB45DRAFT_1051187 [Roridomyces roridus]